MGKILGISGSNSNHSINTKLLDYTTSLIAGHEISFLDIKQYDLPIYDLDLEQESGLPEAITEISNLFTESNGFVFACPEYNGFMPAAMKNVIDWVSRAHRPIFQDKPMLIMATSPGPRGAAWNLKNMAEGFSYRGAQIKGQFSLPSFNDNFTDGKIVNPEFDAELKTLLNDFLAALG